MGEDLSLMSQDRDVSEAFRLAQTEQPQGSLVRLNNAERTLERERETSVELKVAQARGEVERESICLQCAGMRAKLEIARTVAEQSKLDLAMLRNSVSRGLEPI